MTKQIVLTMQRAGMLLIVTVMVIDHFFFSIEEGFILGCAIISAVLLGISIAKLRLTETKEEDRRGCSSTEKKV